MDFRHTWYICIFVFYSDGYLQLVYSSDLMERDKNVDSDSSDGEDAAASRANLKNLKPGAGEESDGSDGFDEEFTDSRVVLENADAPTQVQASPNEKTKVKTQVTKKRLREEAEEKSRLIRMGVTDTQVSMDVNDRVMGVNE